MHEQHYQLGQFRSTVVVHPPSCTLAAVLDVGADAVYIIDAQVKEQSGLPDFPLQYILAVDESKKSMSVVEMLLQWLFDNGVHRNATLCAIGGGVLCDLAAFVASIYQRGIALVLYPTTLLAMLDASFGGKTGINYAGYKNMVGSFYPAHRVVVVPHVLHTLPVYERINGLAEAIKSAMLGDEELFGLLRLRRVEIAEEGDVSLLCQVVERALAVKARMVVADFTDTGQRALLNLGHTFAHALEASGGLGAWSHGRAVAWGIAQALRVGVALGKSDRAYAETVWQLLHDYGYRIAADDMDWGVLLAAMAYDKKATSAMVHDTEEASAMAHKKEATTSAMTHDKKAISVVVNIIVPCALGQNDIVPLRIPRIRELLASVQIPSVYLV